MNICVLNHVFAGGGLETRIKSMAEYAKVKGYNLHLVCDEYVNDNKVEFASISTNRKMIDISPIDLIVEVEFLRKFIRDNDIDFIDSHYGASIAGSIAANMEGVPIGFTVHGPYDYSIEESYKSGYLTKALVMKYGIDRVNAVSEHTAANVRGLNGEVHLVRNGISGRSYLQKSDSVGDSVDRWVLASRLDSFKVQPIKYLIDSLEGVNIKIDIYGDGPERRGLEDYIESKGAIDRVAMKGWSSDFSEVLSEGVYSGVFGMGRVILEAASYDLPCILMGYDGDWVPLDREMFNLFKGRNFTSRGVGVGTSAGNAVRSIYSNPDNYKTYRFITDDLLDECIWEGYFNDIKNLKSNRSSNIIDLYYIMSGIASDIAYDKDNQELYSSLRSRYLNDLKSEIDNADKLFELSVASSNETETVKRELDAVRGSLSWRATKPLRVISNRIKGK